MTVIHSQNRVIVEGKNLVRKSSNFVFLHYSFSELNMSEMVSYFSRCA